MPTSYVSRSARASLMQSQRGQGERRRGRTSLCAERLLLEAALGEHHEWLLLCPLHDPVLRNVHDPDERFEGWKQRRTSTDVGSVRVVAVSGRVKCAKYRAVGGHLRHDPVLRLDVRSLVVDAPTRASVKIPADVSH